MGKGIIEMVNKQDILRDKLNNFKIKNFDELNIKYKKIELLYNEQKETVDKLLKKIKKLENYCKELEIKLKKGEYVEEIDSYLSLCEIGDQGNLYRLADIRDGILYGDFLYWDKNRRNLYGNVDKYGVKKIGIWSWKLKDNVNSGTRNFVCNQELKEWIDPIEIICISSCYTETSLIERIKAGIILNNKFKKLFLCFKKNENYIGVLCSQYDFRESGGGYVFDSDSFSLPVYEISISDVCILNNYGNTSIYNKFSFSEPIGVVFLKKTEDIIKKVLINRINWSVLKNNGFSKKEFQNVKTAIECTVNIVDDIAEECKCDRNTAENFLESFLSNLEQFIKQEDLGDHILRRLIERDDEILQACKDSIANEWHKEHNKIVEDAKRLENNLKKEINNRNLELRQIYENIGTANLDLEKIKQEIEKQSNLAHDVEVLLGEKIKKAREDAASFIVEQAFIGNSDNYNTKSITNCNGKYDNGINLFDDKYEVEDIEDVLDCLSENLDEAGIGRAYQNTLSKYLYVALKKRVPIILAGPNGIEIANALSACLYGRECGVLHCYGEYNASVVEDCMSSDDKIVLIEDAFVGNWSTPIVNLLRNNDKYFLLSVPFAEDLKIIPSSIVNYAIPLVTEIFVDHRADRNFEKIECDEDYAKYEKTGNRYKKYDNLLNSLGMKTYARFIIAELIGEYHSIMNNSDYCKGDYEYVLLSIAYLNDKIDILRDYVANNDSGNLEELKKLWPIFLKEE